MSLGMFAASRVSFIPAGSVTYETPGTFTWVAPAGVTSVCAVAVGGGGGAYHNGSGGAGGGGGGLGWKNNHPVVPGNSYTVFVGSGGVNGTTVGQDGQESYFISNVVVAGGGGSGGFYGGEAAAGSFVGSGGGVGGVGGEWHGGSQAGGGGGAGGYSGAGGAGGNGNGANAGNGAGGGGGGGGSAGSSDTAGAGGGVGLLGEGINGVGGANSGADGYGGSGGSGGTNASRHSTTNNNTNFFDSTTNKSTAGVYGGGAAGSDNTNSEASNGGNGAVRILWGTGRAFPATNVGVDVTPGTYTWDFSEGFDAGMTRSPSAQITTVTSPVPAGFTHAMRIQGYENNNDYYMEKSFLLSEAGEVKFRRMVSSEQGYDYLRFYIDDVQQEQISGEVAYAQVTFPLAAGTRVLRWAFTSDYVQVEGAHNGHVTDIQVTGL